MPTVSSLHYISLHYHAGYGVSGFSTKSRNGPKYSIGSSPSRSLWTLIRSWRDLKVRINSKEEEMTENDLILWGLEGSIDILRLVLKWVLLLRKVISRVWWRSMFVHHLTQFHWIVLYNAVSIYLHLTDIHPHLLGIPTVVFSGAFQGFEFAPFRSSITAGFSSWKSKRIHRNQSWVKHQN